MDPGNTCIGGEAMAVITDIDVPFDIQLRAEGVRPGQHQDIRFSMAALTACRAADFVAEARRQVAARTHWLRAITIIS